MAIKGNTIFYSLLLFSLALIVCFLENGCAIEKTVLSAQSGQCENWRSLEPNSIYIINKKINLKGEKIIIPDSCVLFYKSGCFYNGEVVLKNTQLEGRVVLGCRTYGSVMNDTVKVDWFNYRDHPLYDAFKLAQGRMIQLGEGKKYIIDYAIQIPSCTIDGNNSSIELKSTAESSNLVSVAKIRNLHYDGSGSDSFIMSNLSIITEADNLFLFSMQNTSNCVIKNCSFICKGAGRECSHVVDLRGNNSSIVFDKCKFINKSDAKSGGGLWLRSFDTISEIVIFDCDFYNNSTDEILAFNAPIKDINNVQIINSRFTYQKGLTCPEPHVMIGMTQEKGTIHGVFFSNCRLESDFLPAYLFNIGTARSIEVCGSAFVFNNSTLNSDGINTLFFNGELIFENSIINTRNILLANKATSLTLFHPKAVVTNSIIENNCPNMFLGASRIYNSSISFDNSQLFNGSIPSVMVGCIIKLGRGTPKIAANPYSQNEECEWHDNTIESDIPVDFLFSYKVGFIRYRNNKVKNINIIGTPFKK